MLFAATDSFVRLAAQLSQARNPRCPACDGPAQKAGFKQGRQRYRGINILCERYFFASAAQMPMRYRGEPAGKITIGRGARWWSGY